MFFNRLFDTSWLGAAALAILLIAPLAARAQDSDPVVARAPYRFWNDPVFRNVDGGGVRCAGELP